MTKEALRVVRIAPQQVFEITGICTVQVNRTGEMSDKIRNSLSDDLQPLCMNKNKLLFKIMDKASQGNV